VKLVTGKMAKLIKIMEEIAVDIGIPRYIEFIQGIL
jgi:hypothetical protein